ncbi:effector protein [Campylobacter mucosalis]|uniref:effector protein n=1 Tax=Campylobacter mucosalis TaxID=202 RepID=UPI001F2B899F|nr:effector protein [Campylobacter mucosalis]
MEFSLKFSLFRERNFANYNFFEADEKSYKDFIKFAFDEFRLKNTDTPWYLALDDKAFNSYPNFTQKHQICISHVDFKDAIFQFRISSENSVNSLGYRLFINLDGVHKDFVSSDITQTDKVVIKIKDEILKEFDCLSKCGWWITDVWRDMFEIKQDSDSFDFINEILSHDYTAEILKINQTLFNAQINGELDDFVSKLAVLD